MCGGKTYFIVSVPERSKGVDSSSTVFALVGSNPTADNLHHFVQQPCFVICSLAFCLRIDQSIIDQTTTLCTIGGGIGRFK